MNEKAYLGLVRKILKEGEERDDRTKVGTLSIFAPRAMKFDLQVGFPLLTTKRVYWKGVVEELFWFISGSTDARDLDKRGVKIWNANATREFQDSRGLGWYKEGDLGPIYGFQWRHFGATYRGKNYDYTCEGHDQLKALIEGLKDDPMSRRHILSAWNPCDLDKMVLPPCHLLAQFYVSNDSELSCHLYQRSADMALGVPFNIASYALLVHLISHCCSLKVGTLTHSLGDAHIYLNHIEGLNMQVRRSMKLLPKVFLREGTPRDIDKIRPEDVILAGYKPHPGIKFPFAL